MFSLKINNYDYKLISQTIKKYQKYYQTKIITLKEQYIKSLKDNDYLTLDKILIEKRTIELEIIKKLTNILNIKDSYIFLNGSYARKLTRWHSDIDINILYKNKNSLEYMKTEELLSVMLYKIFKLKGRDKIHSMMIYSKEKYQYCPKITDNKYSLIFTDNKKINYICRKNYEHIYPTIHNTSREISDYESYLKENINKHYYEWLYSYDSLDSKEEIYNIISKIDKKVISSKYFIPNLLSKINIEKNNNKILIKKLTKVPISTLNKQLKINNLNKIYNLLTIIRLFLIYNEEEIKNLEFDQIINSKLLINILDSNLIKELEINIKKYMLFLSRIEYLMEFNNLNFSSREEKNILISSLEKKYNSLYSSCLKEDYNERIIKLNKTINEVLIKIEGEINKDE